MFANITGWHMVLLLVVVLILFGAARLPALAKGVGQSVRILRRETGAAELPDPQDQEAVLEQEVVEGRARHARVRKASGASRE